MSLSSSASLIQQLLLRDLTVRYRSSFLGFLWSLVKPAATIALFYVVFEKVLGIQRGGMAGLTVEVNYGLFLAIGIITWSFVSAATVEGTNAYLAHHHLITRALFWRPCLPLSAVLGHWVHYWLAQAVLVALLAMGQSCGWGIHLLALIPLSLAELALVVALVWILAPLQVYARDTQSFLEVGLMVWFYGSPIIYTADMALNILSAHHLSFLYLLNPLAPLLVLRQKVLLWNVLEGPPLGERNEMLIISLVAFALELFLLFALAHNLNRKINREIADRL